MIKLLEETVTIISAVESYLKTKHTFPALIAYYDTAVSETVYKMRKEEFIRYAQSTLRVSETKAKQVWQFIVEHEDLHARNPKIKNEKVILSSSLINDSTPILSWKI